MCPSIGLVLTLLEVCVYSLDLCCNIIRSRVCGVSEFTGLDYWTGLLDSLECGFNTTLHDHKAIQIFF